MVDERGWRGAGYFRSADTITVHMSIILNHTLTIQMHRSGDFIARSLFSFAGFLLARSWAISALAFMISDLNHSISYHNGLRLS